MKIGKIGGKIKKKLKKLKKKLSPQNILKKLTKPLNMIPGMQHLQALSPFNPDASKLLQALKPPI